METPVESELVIAAQNGDRQALDLLIGRYLPLVHDVVNRALGDDPDAGDVVQETFIQLIRSLPTLRDPELFRSWLMTMAIRKVQDHERRRVRGEARQRPLELLAESEHPRQDFVDVTIAELGLTGLRQEVAEATRLVPPGDRALLALWWQEVAGTLTRAELAEAGGISREHAAVRVQRLKARLDVARLTVRARHGRYRCPDLQALLPAPGDDIGPTALSRISRHMHQCERCRPMLDRLPPPERLLSGMALVPVTLGLARRVADLIAGGGAAAGPVPLAARPVLAAKPVAVLGSALAAGALAIGLAVLYLPGGGDPAPARPAPPVVSTPAAPAVPSSAPAGRPVPVSASPRPVHRIAPAAGVSDADIFVAPDGDDAGSGRIGDPFATLARAVSVVRPGQVIALRGGRYRPSGPVVVETDGTAQEPVVVSNYRRESPVLDASAAGAGQPFITHRADHWTVQGLEITGARAVAYRCDSCQDNTFRRLTVHDGQATGFVIGGPGSSRNLVVDSDFHDNHDDARHGADADGLSIHSGSGTGNVVRACRFYRNADDGFDVEAFGDAVTVQSSWSFDNGVNRWGLSRFAGSGNGFRLGAGGGGVAHVVGNDAAWGNAGAGFAEATNEAGRMRLERNTAYGNGGLGFDLPRSPSVYIGNLSVDNERYPELSDQAEQEGNAWNETKGWNAGRLASVDPAGTAGPRPADGSLPATTFLTVPGSTGIGASMRE